MRMFTLRHVAVAALAATAVQVSACSSSPAAQMTAPGAPSGTLAGTVVGAAGGAATSSVPGRFTTLQQGTSGLTITVMGTNLSAHTDQTGAFVIEGIPAGSTITLHFSGSDTNATLTIDGMSDGEVRHITVRVDGSTAELEDDDQDPDENDNDSNVQDIEGLISALNPAGPTITVNGFVISVPAATPIRHGSRSYQFSDLALGDRVHVKATMVASVLTAQEVKLQNGDATPGNGNK